MTIRRVLAPIWVGLCVWGMAVAQEPNRQPMTFHIEAQPIRLALQQFGQQAGLQVSMRLSGKAAEDIRVPAVSGELTAQQALERMLANSELKYEFVNDRAVRISAVGAEGAYEPVGGDSTKKPQTSDPGTGKNPSSQDSSAQANSSSNSEGSSSKGDSDQIQEIVVTAQKRKENLQDVPISISVLRGDALDESTVQGVAEALNRVPGVINHVGGGASRAGASGGSVVIRGVSTTLVGGATTAYYLDSVPFGFANSTSGSYSPDASAYDLERVEVLRGPQGTLYGASALNGVVRVLTHEPNLDEFEFKARTAISGTDGGGENYRGDAALNIPIVEGALAVRGVVGLQDLGGWLDNANEKEANDTQAANYRLRIAAEPTDRLSLGFLSWISRSDVGAPSNSANGETRPSTVDERASVDFDLYGFNVDYDFEGFTFTSSTSQLDFENNGRFDYHPFLGADIYQDFIFGSEVFSQEVSLSSAGDGAWRWSIGAMYRDAEDYTNLLRTVASTGAFAPGFLAPIEETRSSKSYAVFAEVTRLMFDGQFELTAGLRQFHDKTRYDEVSNRLAVGGVPPTGLVHSTGEFDHLTPRLVAAWHPLPDSTLYASYGEGFRSGIAQSAEAGARGYPAVGPDALTNYEIGYKTRAWGGRVNFEGAVFYIDWQDIMRSQNVTLSTSPLVIIPAFVNAGSASGLGFEAGVSVEVVDGLTLGGNFSWSGLESDQDVFDGATLATPKGGRLANSPEYSAAAFADYKWPLGGGFDGRLSMSANYTPERIAQAGFFSSTAEATLFARASFALEAADHWSASFFVENLTNEGGTVYDPFFTLTNPQHVWDTYQRPRTIGVQLEYRY